MAISFLATSLNDADADVHAMRFEFDVPAFCCCCVAHCIQATPVWRQIDQLCDRSSDVAPLRLQQLRADKQQMQTRLGQQDQVIAQLQDEVAQLRAELDRCRSTQG
jgi:septal ring factor EnvC (AmiA/AmiB activator)